jgi:hypothetical protein
MRSESGKKIEIMHRMFEALARHYDLVTMGEHAARIEQKGQLSLRPLLN